MTRILRSIGLVLALVTAGLGGTALAWTAGNTPAAASGGGTPLPPGWELCVLEGLSAPATSANVTDLDEWQAAEGGSTNNTAAFNPFNTGRTTDTNGAPIPGVVPSANGFPAFTDWAGGCSATVATLFQPNMWVITAALRAGTVAPPAAFLAVVDQSAWCAPSPDGLPCYASSLLGVARSLPVSFPVSSALAVYGNVTSDLQLLPAGHHLGDGRPGVAGISGAVARRNAGAGRDGARRVRYRVESPPGVCRSVST